MSKKNERELIEEVEQRLVRKFAHLSAGLIATAVDDAYLRFESSLIRDYIPLLVERRAHNELASITPDSDLSVELAQLTSDPELSIAMAPTH